MPDCCDHSKAHPSPFACTCRKHPPSILHPYGEDKEPAPIDGSGAAK